MASLYTARMRDIKVLVYHPLGEFEPIPTTPLGVGRLCNRKEDMTSSKEVLPVYRQLAPTPSPPWLEVGARHIAILEG